MRVSVDHDACTQSRAPLDCEQRSGRAVSGRRDRQRGEVGVVLKTYRAGELLLELSHQLNRLPTGHARSEGDGPLSKPHSPGLVDLAVTPANGCVLSWGSGTPPGDSRAAPRLAHPQTASCCLQIGFCGLL